MKTTVCVLLCCFSFLAVECQDQRSTENTYSQARLVKEIMGDTNAKTFLDSLAEQYKAQIAEVKTKYPLVYDRIILTDMAVAATTPITQVKSPLVRKTFCLLFNITRQDHYRVFCDGDSLDPRVLPCGLPMDFIKAAKHGPNGEYVEGRDFEGAWDAWNECRNNPPITRP